MKKHSESIAKKIEEFEQVCRREGLALTFQRRIIIETIAGRGKKGKR